MQIRSFYVKPNIPEKLQPLREIAYNLWFSWNWSAIELFLRLGGPEWSASYQNPVRMLGMVPQERYDKMAADDSFVASVQRVHQEFRAYMDLQDTWFHRNHAGADGRIAYFSMEFGLDESLPVYSGGLGVLAGDHLKSASDLGLPLVGVGLLYREGYFRQYLNADGWQQEAYPINDWYTMPVTQITGQDGRPLSVSVQLPDGEVRAQVWRVDVGRIQLYLLDTDLPENSPAQREITAQLYGGDTENRIRQEMVMGVGGLRALRAMGINPAVCHMNEGHSAFLTFERLAMFMEDHGCDLATARELLWASSVFTTHTPVPAGNERFDPGLVRKYTEGLGHRIGMTWDQMLGLGRERPDDTNEPFCMTVLALKLAAHCNAVAALHGVVSREMWQGLWPTLPVKEVPIGHVTNGVHLTGWLSHDLTDLYSRYVGPKLREDHTDFSLYERIESIPAIEVWRTHERRRERLVTFARQRLRCCLERRNAPPAEIAHADEILDPRALTIGFARRFATYKRATLLLRDPDRLARILLNEEHPVQLIFAGKAHPHDNPGKSLIQQLVHFARDERFRHKVVFLEDYDISVARYLVQGADIWLNTPRRPKEASGTSGMKAAINGVLNCSILDGWWDEGYSKDTGWAIGAGEQYADEGQQDYIESQALYDLIENQIAPLFYDRGRDGLPREWVRRMKVSMTALGGFFNTSRMVSEYTDKYYSKALGKFHELSANGMSVARDLAGWRRHIDENWGQLAIESVSPDNGDFHQQVGDCATVTARIRTGNLSTDNLLVELVHGAVDHKGELTSTQRTRMQPKSVENGVAVYEGCIACQMSGRYGFSVRVLPTHPTLVHPYDGKHILWA